MEHKPTLRVTNLLEASLRFWEDTYLLGQAGAMGTEGKVFGVEKHWSEFRDYLLSLREGEFDELRFLAPDPSSQASSMRWFPRHLAAWTAGSRRIFSLPKELWEEFWMTDYGGLRWDELLWPFDSFIIAPDPPIGHSETMELTMVAVSMLQGKFKPYPKESADEIELLPIGQNPNNAQKLDRHLSHEQRKKLRGFLEAGRYKAAARLMLRLTNPNREWDVDPRFIGRTRIKKEGLVEDHGNSHALDLQLRRIVAGFCLYMENLPSSGLSTSKEGWGEPSTANVRNVISNGLDVCDVRKLHELSPETLVSFSQKKRIFASRTVEPHARRGYWRRRRGEGNNPLAPKEVEVKPTWIHRDKVPEGAMPGGATSALK